MAAHRTMPVEKHLFIGDFTPHDIEPQPDCRMEHGRERVRDQTDCSIRLGGALTVRNAHGASTPSGDSNKSRNKGVDGEEAKPRPRAAPAI